VGLGVPRHSKQEAIGHRVSQSAHRVFGLNPTPETQKQDTPRFCLSTEPTASDEHGPPAQPSNLPSGAKDTPRRRRHQSHSFGSGPRSSPEAAQRGVEDAGLEVGPEPKDHGTGRPFS
jgi:hypothetical protein